jgi:hypothetical protein
LQEQAGLVLKGIDSAIFLQEYVRDCALLTDITKNHILFDILLLNFVPDVALNVNVK